MSVEAIPSTHSHPQATPQLPPSFNPVTRPGYGSSAYLESGADLEDEYYDDEDEDWEIEEELAKLEQDYADEEIEPTDDAMESWPSAVPNRLGGKGEGSIEGIENDDTRLSCLGLPLSLPYNIETLAEMDERLEQIACKLVECVKAREWGLGFRLWDSQLSIWMSMGYPMKKEMKIKLIFVYYEIIFVPGLSSSFIEDAGNQFIGLVSDRNLNIYDFRIPWRKLYDALYNELFPHPQRLARHTVNLAPMYLNVAEAAQRFFHPGDVDEMLDVILPPFKPTMDSILASQTFLVHFLPISHCSKWLPLIFRLWYGFNSGLWDDQASDLIGQLAIAHVDPGRSDPSLIAKIPRGTFNTPEEEAKNPNIARAERAHKARLLSVSGEIEEDNDGLTYWADYDKMPEEIRLADPNWQGIRKDVGIFTEQEFEFLMSKCLRSLNVPVGGSLASSNAMSVTTADARASRKILDAKKPIDRVQSLAETIIFCMSYDAPEAVPSGQATPSANGSTTPMLPAVSRLQNGAAMKRGGSSDSLALAGKKEDAHRRYLAGSKALDHLSRLLTSCETFFHPSNSGPWSAFLTVFLSHLAGNFVERWKAEEDRLCKTPAAWRLTPEIKRQFVLCLRPLALTSMFNKDMESVQPAVSALKKLALLEPDLIMPALMERATPSLQGLEETQRTPAVTYALAILAQPLAVRQLWRVGGMYVGDIFTLLIPGIDLNDPAKTGLSCMAISNMVDFIRLSDVSEVEHGDEVKHGSRALRKAIRLSVEDDPDDPLENEMKDLTPDDANARIRLSTSVFRDWVPEFLGRVMLLFSNLPEEGGKSGKAGGKTEAMTLSSVLHTCGGVFAALDDKLFDSVLDSVFEYATTTCRSNAVDAVGELVRNLAAANAPKVFAKFFPVARQRIISELKAGASSTRSQTTSIPLPGDAALHWWQSILLGTLMPGRIELSGPEYKDEYVSLLQTMIESTYSERGWVWTGKILEKSMSCLVAIYHRDLRMVNPEEFTSDDFRLNHHLWWGKLYRANEIDINWKMPSEADINMAFDILNLAKSATDNIGGLLDKRAVGDQIWSNEFCRALNVIDKVLRGAYNLILEIDSLKQGGKKAESYLPPDMLKLPPPFKCGVLLQDPEDPRYQQVLEIRRLIGETLTRAASAMRDAGESDNSVEAVKLLVTTMGTLLTAYGIKAKQFSTAQNALTGIMAQKKLYEGQRKFHRSIFLAAASVHHQNRLTTLAYNRVRSELDDRLISNLLDFCLSPFTRIRRSAQHVLENIARLYRGTWVLAFPKLFDALQPGTDPDTMKGALYVLRYNALGISRIGRDWRQLPQLVECLLGAHHENKASIQALVTKATDELLHNVREPSSYEINVRVEKVDEAIQSLEDSLKVKASSTVVDQLHSAIVETRTFQDQAHNTFVDKLITIASDPSLNWRYIISASRFLLVCARRDQPTDVRLAKYFGENAQNPHPRIRDFSMIGFTKLLFTITLRSFCAGSEERIFLEEPDDPWSSEIELKDTSPEFTAKYLTSFREPLPEDVTTVQLQDRLDTGWLAWGKTMEVCRMSGWDEKSFTLDPPCEPAAEVLRGILTQAGWWQNLADHWAREDQRNYPSAGHIDFIVSSSQLFGKPIFDYLQPIIEAFLVEMDKTKVYDRHKTRAMWEFISGIVRGSEDWPGKDRTVVWEWFSSKLPELFNNIRHDTTKCWDISIEYILNERDPRRNKPLIDFCMDTALNADFNGGSAFDLTRRVQLVRSILRCLQWRFAAWGDETAEFYFKAIACPYAEVRNLLASVFNAVDQLKFHPSYSSPAALTEDVLSDTHAEKDIMGVKAAPFMPQFSQIMTSLQELKKDRPHGPKAVLSQHDTSAVTALTWIMTELSDVHAVGSFPYIIPFLSEIFELRELNDDPDLQRVAGRLLAMITSITPPFDLIDPLMSKLISILQDSSSWRTKMNCMPVLSLVYFRNLSLLSESCKAKCLDVVSTCLRDPNQEVREMASSTLSGFLRCSQRAMVVVLKDRFNREIASVQIPKRRGAEPGQVNPEYQSKIVALHGAILGATALVEAFPYTVPKFIPKLLADVLAPRVSEPAPISTTIRSCVASFKRTHEKYQDKFSEDELSAMNYAQAGNSYYA